MDMGKYIQKQINKGINYRSFLQLGVITAVNSDGTYDVKLRGRDYSYKSLPFNDKAYYALKVGNSVLVGYANGDKQKPCIIQAAAYGTDSDNTVVDI